MPQFSRYKKIQQKVQVKNRALTSNLKTLLSQEKLPTETKKQLQDQKLGKE